MLTIQIITNKSDCIANPCTIQENHSHVSKQTNPFTKWMKSHSMFQIHEPFLNSLSHTIRTPFITHCIPLHPTIHPCIDSTLRPSHSYSTQTPPFLSSPSSLHSLVQTIIPKPIISFTHPFHFLHPRSALNSLPHPIIGSASTSHSLPHNSICFSSFLPYHALHALHAHWTATRLEILPHDG